MGTWEMIRDERASLVEALAQLPAEYWSQPSLCAGWTVQDVVAHMIATTQITPPTFFLGFVKAGFSFNNMVQKDIDATKAGHSPAEMVATFRTRVDARSKPPGPLMALLGETIVHGEDIFRALGSYRTHPPANLVAVADFYKGSNALIGSRNRIKGFTLKATDADWTYVSPGQMGGDPHELAGPLVALVMAMTGRTLPLHDLSGDGAEIWKKRAHVT